MKRTVTLNIAGAKYRMVADTDEEHLQRLATLVNDRIAALGSKATKTASTAQLLAVVALGLADDLLASEDRRKKIEETMRSAISRAIERIDRRLSVEPAGERSD